MGATSDEAKLRRLLYLTEKRPVYIAGNPEDHFLKDFERNLEVVTTIVKNSEESFIKVLVEAGKDDLLPRRNTLFYVLAYAFIKTETHKNDLTRNALAEAALKIFATDEELFRFISFFTKLNRYDSKNKITTAVGGMIKKYLEKKTPMEYAYAVGKAKGYHGWKYKDLIKLSHYKSQSVEKTLITSYVLFGLDKLKDQESEQMKNIYSILEKYERLRKTEHEKEASTLVKELHANFNQVNPKLIKSQEVWAAIILELPTREVLRLLPKFYKYGMLKINSKVHKKVVEAVTSLAKIRECKLSPIEVFIYMKDFDKGGKPMDPKLEGYLKIKKEGSSGGNAKERIEKIRAEPKCFVLTTAIGKCLNFSYPKNLHSLGMGKRIVLALDVTGHSETMCFKNKNITCLEAELALTLYFFKTEKNINVTIYHNKDVKGFNLDKNAAFSQSLKKLQDNKSEYMMISNVFDWALGKKKPVDVFISLIQSVQSVVTAPKEVRTPGWNSLKEGLLNYQKKMSSPSTKMVIICPGTHNLAGFDDTNILTVCGFCPEIPRVVKAFVEESFS